MPPFNCLPFEQIALNESAVSAITNVENKTIKIPPTKNNV